MKMVNLTIEDKEIYAEIIIANGSSQNFWAQIEEGDVQLVSPHISDSVSQFQKDLFNKFVEGDEQARLLIGEVELLIKEHL